MSDNTIIYLIEANNGKGDYTVRGFTFLHTDARNIVKVDPERYKVTAVTLHLGAMDALAVWKKLASDYEKILETHNSIEQTKKDLEDERQ